MRTVVPVKKSYCPILETPFYCKHFLPWWISRNKKSQYYCAGVGLISLFLKLILNINMSTPICRSTGSRFSTLTEPGFYLPPGLNDRFSTLLQPGFYLPSGLNDLYNTWAEPATFGEAWALQVGTADATTRMRAVCDRLECNERIRAEVLLDGYARWREMRQHRGVASRDMPLPPRKPNLDPIVVSPAYRVHDVAALTLQLPLGTEDKVKSKRETDLTIAVSDATAASVGREAGDAEVKPFAVLLPSNDQEGLQRVLEFVEHHHVRWLWVVAPLLERLPSGVFKNNVTLHGVGYLLPECTTVEFGWMYTMQKLRVVAFAAVPKITRVGHMWLCDCPSLKTVLRGHFQEFISLKEVGVGWLSECDKLEDLSDGSFQGLGKLVGVGGRWLSNNSALSSVSFGVFQGMDNLRTVGHGWLGYNRQLSYVHPLAFDCLTSLETARGVMSCTSSCKRSKEVISAVLYRLKNMCEINQQQA